MRQLVRMSVVGIAVAGLCVATSNPGSADAATGAPVVVVSGLNNPRQLDLVGNTLFIAEAGSGGSEAHFTGPEGDVYVGRTGSISAVHSPRYAHDTSPLRVVTGLMSGAGSDGSFATGSDGVAARYPNGRLYIQETYFPPAQLPTEALRNQNGRTLYASPHHAIRPFANPSYFELANDPDGQGFDSDPYAIVARGSDYLVADAAGNDVLRIDSHGHSHLWHVFPNVTDHACAGQFDPTEEFPGCNFVPTSIAIDSSGYVYVGGLSSLTPQMGEVVRLTSDGKTVLGTWHGFSAVSGLAVGPTGVLYVSELFGDEANPPFPEVQGVLTRVDRNNVRTHKDIPFPAGLAVNSHGVVFVSAWSVAPAGGLAGPQTSGQVWRLKW
jgi:hypothetical protein